jgi:hypothetical protein
MVYLRVCGNTLSHLEHGCEKRDEVIGLAERGDANGTVASCTADALNPHQGEHHDPGSLREDRHAPGRCADTLTSTPIGTKGVAVPPPYAAGASGDQPPPDVERLDHYPLAGGTPAPLP